MDTHDTPTDLITTSEAVRLLPGSRPGRTPHLASLYRWIQQGRLRAWKIAGRLHVSRADVLALLRPVEPRRKAAKGEREPTRAEADRLTDEVLRRHGLT